MLSLNPLYLLLIIPALLARYAQKRVAAIYEKYGDEPNQQNASGMEIARKLLAEYGLATVHIEHAPGHYTDHYDPGTKTLRLSDGVANARSITALGVVAHEVGHAAQDAEGYRLMRLRTMLAQRISVVSQWSSFAFLGALLYGSTILMVLAGAFMAALVVFTLVTLPIERNASTRALAMLERTGLAAAEERRAARAVLQSAAFTYLAALGQRLGTFLFFALIILAARGVGQL
jgi:uncharacterized protein